jgi:hypothetical protein
MSSYLFANRFRGGFRFTRCIGKLMVAAYVLLTGMAQAAESVWAYPSYTQRMIYKPDAQGDRISDYSIVGYRQSKASIPNVPVAATVFAGDGDDTARVQAAIDQVAAMPLGPDGFRGAVLLKSGLYDIAGQIAINASGIVLRGEGYGDTGTIVRARGTDQRALVNISGSGSMTFTGPAYSILDKTVPAGANSFRVNSTAGLNVGDSILLTRPSTAEWIHDIGMDQLDIPWTEGSKNLKWERTVTRIEENRVFLDTPLTNSLEQKYGGGTFQKFSYPGRIENVGVEFLRGESDYASSTDEAHSWDFVTIDQAQNAWVRGTKARYFAYSLVTVSREAKWVTAVDNVSEMPKSQITGGRRYSYNIVGQQSLVTDCQASQGRHDFVLSSVVAGPNVFYNSTATSANADSGPHHRWSTGALFDNITVSGNEINVQNRWNSGTGHGWSGANMVIWNSTAAGYTVQNPPTAQNWLIGSVGQLRGSDFPNPYGNPAPYLDSHGTNVTTDSLYQAQLADTATIRSYHWTGGSGNWSDVQKWDRFAVPAVRTIQMRDYLIGDIDNFYYDANANDDYYIDPAFLADVDSHTANPIGGFDKIIGNRHVTFTQLFSLGAGEQVVNASLALAIQPTGGSWTNDNLMIEGVGSFSLDSLNWTRAVGQTSVGVFDFGPYLAALQNGKLNVDLSDDTAADFALLALQVAAETPDPQGADVTISGGTVVIDSLVPAVGNITVLGSSTVLNILGDGHLTAESIFCEGTLAIGAGALSSNAALDSLPSHDVPEPGVFALLGLAIAGGVISRRFRGKTPW